MNMLNLCHILLLDSYLLTMEMSFQRNYHLSLFDLYPLSDDENEGTHWFPSLLCSESHVVLFNYYNNYISLDFR